MDNKAIPVVREEITDDSTSLEALAVRRIKTLVGEWNAYNDIADVVHLVESTRRAQIRANMLEDRARAMLS